MLAKLSKSLRIKLIIATIAAPSLINGVFSAIKIHEDRVAVIKEMDSIKERVLNELAHGLSDPLWNLNMEQAKTLVKLKLKERDFIGIVIVDLETYEQVIGLYQTDDKIEEIKANEMNHRKFSTYKSIKINKNGLALWEANCFFTDRFIRELIIRNIKYSLTINLVTTATLTILLIITLNFLVINPIKTTTDLIKRIAQGDFSKRITVRQTDEIGEIGNEVNSLLNQLQLTISEVNLVMEAMAEGDFSKRMTVDLSGDLARLRNHINHSIEMLNERTRQLKAAQQELIEKAHKAGMADVASGTLHNVGNILNSIRVSAQVIRNDMEKSAVDNFQKANELLRENYNDLENFILRNPKGKKLFEYYLKLEDALLGEKENIQENLVRLNEKIDMIVDVIAAQQSYAGISSLTEKYALELVIEDALTLQSGSINRYGIQVIKKFSTLPLIPIQKAKLVHILINLIKNAKESMLEVPVGQRKLTISLEKYQQKVLLKVQDTGVGIAETSLKKIFTHGYTTKKDGHGFGLHSCANYMTEMNGKIWAESGGINRGATFALEFDIS